MKTIYNIPFRMSVLVLSLLPALAVAFSNAEGTVGNRISEGYTAPRNEVTFIAALLRDSKGTGRLFRYACAGILVSTRHVLSVASCFENEYSEPSRWRARLGSRYSDSGGAIYAASSIIIHRKFDPDTKSNNIAMMGLDQEVILGPYIHVAELPLPGDAPDLHAFSKTAGWGALSISQAPTPALHIAHVPVLDPEKCRASYATIDVFVQDSTICAGASNVDLCNGDEGSPLIVENVVFGIVSNFAGCSGGVHPGIYTALSHFTDWIHENLYKY